MTLSKNNIGQLEAELNDRGIHECIRHYQCSECVNLFSEIVRRNDQMRRITCPECQKKTLETYIDGTPTCFVKLSTSEIRQVGHLAHRNAEYMSADQMKMLAEKNRTKKTLGGGELPSGMSRIEKKEPVVPWWRKGVEVPKNLMSMTKKQKDDYVMTGKKTK